MVTLKSFFQQTLNSTAKGDNLWNYAYSGAYDRGSNNYGPVPCFDLSLGATVTQASGSWSNASWSTDAQGLLRFNSRQDTANAFWTYLYVKTARMITVPLTGDGDLGAYVDTNSCTAKSSAAAWNLNAGWNTVLITSYNQNQSYSASIGGEIASMVDIMNSKQLNIPQFVADYNGDGLSDIGMFDASTGTFSVLLNNGNGFASAVPWISNYAVNQNILVGDFNGDGMNDIAYYDASAGIVHVALSNGSKFVDNGVWLNTAGSGIPASAGVLVGQFFGTPLEDLAFVYKDSSNNWKTQLAKNSGTNFVLNSTVYSLQIASSATVMATDINGDGLTDLVGFDASSGTWYVHLNANGFPFNGDYYKLSNFGTGKAPVLADFNGDGTTDIGYYDYFTGTISYTPTVTDTFGSLQSVHLTSSIQTQDAGVEGGYFNTTGTSGFMVVNSIGQREVFASSSIAPFDYLVSINNGVGATTAVQYDSIFNYKNTYMPYSIPVVKSTTTTVGSQSYWTRYMYSGGLWDRNYREFDGFKTVTVTDPEGNYAQTTYAQEHWLKGHPQEQDTYDASGNLYAKSINTWSTQTIATNSNYLVGGLPQVSVFGYIARADNYLYDGNTNAIPKRTAQEFVYGENPQYGDPTQVINDGQVDPSSGLSLDPNKTITTTTYVNNTNSGLVGLPSQTMTTDVNGNTMAKTFFYYDGDSTGTAKPSLGRLTAKVNWLGSSTQPDPKTSYAYDSYGNLSSTTDPNGNVTTIVYDNTVHMFPVKTVNALKQTVSLTYYGIDGVALDNGLGLHGLWGQQRSRTDANNQIVYSSFDVFGRPSSVIAPFDSVALPTQQKNYSIQSNYIQVTDTARVSHGSTQTISSSSFYDGLGRLIEKKSLGSNAGQYIVAGQTVYDNRGLPITKYIPHFTSNDLNTLDTIDTTVLAAQAVYDPMGRVLTQTNPDTSYASMSYAQWTTTMMDENGHKQQSLADAFGRLVQKQEYMGADGRSAYYPSSAYTLYATTNYTYNPQGNLIKVTDAKGNVTTISYDHLGLFEVLNG